jgi:hypothetical protein
MQVMTRKEAIRRRRKMYYNGKPCPKGHMDLRFTHTCQCVRCKRELDLRRYHEQKETAENEQHAYA